MESNLSHCDICNRDDIPAENLELHKLRCKKIEKESNSIATSQNNSSSSIAAPAVQSPPVSTSSASAAVSIPAVASASSAHSRSEEKKEDKIKRNELNVKERNNKQSDNDEEEQSAVRAPIQPVVERLIPAESVASAPSTHPIPMRDLFHAHDMLRPVHFNANPSSTTATAPSFSGYQTVSSSSPFTTHSSTAQFGTQVIGGDGRTITTSRTITLDTGVLLGGATGMLLGAAVGAFFGALSGDGARNGAVNGALMGGATGAALSVMENMDDELRARTVRMPSGSLQSNSLRRNFIPQSFFDDAERNVNSLCEELPIITYDGTASWAEDNNHKTCTVCLEPFTRGDRVIILPCLHRFHLMCCKKWWVSKLHSSFEDPFSSSDRSKPTCPTCKGDVLDFVEKQRGL